VRLLPLLAIVLVFSSCRGTYSYTPKDLKQVRRDYRLVVPIYEQFRTAFLRGNGRAIRYWHVRELATCRLNNRIDKRDSIDPRTNLWAASVTLDDLCNAMDSGYAYWAMQHHLPYDKKIYPAPPDQVFVGSDAELLLLPKEMAHPAATMACPTPIITTPC